VSTAAAVTLGHLGHDRIALGRPGTDGGRGGGWIGLDGLAMPLGYRWCPQARPTGEYGGGVPCGFGWAVPACLAGWSEPGDQAKGGDTW
jgi:hypothetical protein